MTHAQQLLAQIEKAVSEQDGWHFLASGRVASRKLIEAALAEAEDRGRAAGWAQAKEMAAQRAHNCGHPMLAQLIRALSDPPAAGGSHD